jgi:uncharacterized heparinase superfamily protein
MTRDIDLTDRIEAQSEMTDNPESGRHTNMSRLSLLGDTENWPLLYHTLSRMERRQLTGVVQRLARQQLLPALPVDFDGKYERQIPDTLTVEPEPISANNATLRACLPARRRAQYRRRGAQAQTGTIHFLNTSVNVTDAGTVDWFPDAAETLPALWALKFHGFEFLRWPIVGHTEDASAFDQFVRDWDDAASTRIGAENYLRRAWTPHAVSLRILNWCRYYALRARDADDAFLRRLRRLIYKNANFLSRHVEHDVGGNHLIENAIALVMAGVFFAADDWRQSGITLLEAESEQFLPDGGHFERSPMYHLLTLTRYLTALDVLQASGHRPPQTLVQTARRGSDFLAALRPPDGRIPLLNDAVFGEALPLDSCLAYTRRVDCIQSPDADDGRLSDGVARDALPTSGYYWLGTGGDRLLVDGGPFGPPHLPAHSHNDCLAVCLWADGDRILCDTGTYEYAPTARRQRSRSVRGHSTVQVGTTEPVEIGGQYLAGPRIDPRVRYVSTDSLTMFDGSYRRQGSRSTAYTHRRRIYSDGTHWLLQDRVTGAGKRPVRSRLHLHPTVDVESDGRRLALAVDGETRVSLLALGVTNIATNTTPYYPEFGREEQRTTIRFALPSSPPASDLLLSKEPATATDYQGFRETVAAHDCDDILDPL